MLLSQLDISFVNYKIILFSGKLSKGSLIMELDLNFAIPCSSTFFLDILTSFAIP